MPSRAWGCTWPKAMDSRKLRRCITVAPAGPRAKSGHVGKPIPGVEVRIDRPNADGVGEVLARGPNVMLGYRGDAESTSRSIDRDGWLRTGDLGKIDRRGQLVIVGRAKDVIVSSSGENVYPDDVEAKLGEISLSLRVRDRRSRTILAAGSESRASRCRSPTRLATRAERHTRAKRSLDKALSRAAPARCARRCVTILDAPLPRTATRKVKRSEVRRHRRAHCTAFRAAAATGRGRRSRRRGACRAGCGRRDCPQASLGARRCSRSPCRSGFRFPDVARAAGGAGGAARCAPSMPIA